MGRPMFRNRRRADLRKLFELLSTGYLGHQLRLERRLLGELVQGFADRFEASEIVSLTPRDLVAFLTEQIGERLEAIAALRRGHADFGRRYARAADRSSRHYVLLEYAKALGSRGRNLRRDRRALDLWFDRDALEDRYATRHADFERRIALYLDRMGEMAALHLVGSTQPAEEWVGLELEHTVRPLLAYDGDSRVRLAAFRALIRPLAVLPAVEQERRVDDRTLQYIYRAAIDSRQDLWVQREALEVLEGLSTATFGEALRRRLSRPLPGDDLFVRARAATLLGRALERVEGGAELFLDALSDPSPHVRQALAAALATAPAAIVVQALQRLCLDDDDAAVRGAALGEVTALLKRPELVCELREVVARALAQESHAYPLRMALRTAAEGLVVVAASAGEAEGQAWAEALRPAITRLHLEAPDLAVRRWAAEAREDLWFACDPDARALAGELAARLGVAGGRARRLPRDLLRRHDRLTLERVLAILARHGQPLEVATGWLGPKLQRGHRVGYRSWRVLHELRRPSSDKRQAHRHTVGRIFRGLLSAPSSILGELAETKVPGEPLVIDGEGGWRPYLPLLDQVVSCLDQGWPTRPLRIVTADGVTELWPPASPLARLRARSRLTLRFAHYAALRNWRKGDSHPPEAYLAALRELGFRSRFHGHPAAGGGQQPVDPSIGRFFPALFPPSLELQWQRASEYFFSVYENTLWHLVAFVTAATGYFLGRHIYLHRKLRAARRALPLVIGGWGTRGKSGTERLKAALLNALGYSIVSKTTGCEAMFLVAPAYGRLREMFLFRPYEKATIWEQVGLVRLAARLRGEVFLWECMGLTPAYVRILQRQWMRDDYSTITNTYPDHEDIQGPAGIDIPQVMTNFIPERGVLLTSEEQMLPVLVDAADALGTRVRAVGWREAGRISGDVLRRFPYDEHPYNIALVLALAEELGIERDFALKEMADRVVPDLGVLKTYPVAEVEGRRLEFVMGMSANEQYGALGNWRRLGFDRHDLDRDPEVWVATVVNNRADRVPRSQVFAALLVNEVAADRHVLIGGNLSGLQGYLRAAWDAWAAELSLWDGDADASTVLEAEARRLRVPISEAQVEGRLRGMLAGLGIESSVAVDRWRDADRLAEAIGDVPGREALLAAVAADRQALEEYRQLASAVGAATARDTALETRVKAMLWQWFQRKLVVVEDYYARGDEVIRTVAGSTPPGLRARIMGMQNIKGTGLDFVYRWQAWDACHRACQQTLVDDPVVARAGLATLAAFPEYGVLAERAVRETVAEVRRRGWSQHEEVQAACDAILERIASDEDGADAARRRRSPWLARLLAVVEEFLDAGDAVRRRRRADLVYRELVAHRIGVDRAAAELQRLNDRQKGGWLGRGQTTGR